MAPVRESADGDVPTTGARSGPRSLGATWAGSERVVQRVAALLAVSGVVLGVLSRVLR